jgi:hypothetical protein
MATYVVPFVSEQEAHDLLLVHLAQRGTWDGQYTLWYQLAYPGVLGETP